MWSYLFANGPIKIHFAHRTFAWANEASGKAAVHVVIIGFGAGDVAHKPIYEYDRDNQPAGCTLVSNISPYLVAGSDGVVSNRSTPISDVPKMSWGNKPTDGGHLLLSPAERADLLAKEPQAAVFVRRYMGGGDFINNVERYCLWLKDADPAVLRTCTMVMDRVEKVREFRAASSAKTTRDYASKAKLFRQIAQPDGGYLAVPEVSSENRPYIPIAFVSGDVICSNTVQFVPDATPYHFGILSSTMHMAWMRQVCGRLESRYRYSNTLVYNNYPWPSPTPAQRAAIETAAQAVLDARASYLSSGSNLADLYDPRSMPDVLGKAHEALDRAVEKSYRSKGFATERERFEFLFGLYEKLVAPLAPAAKVGRKAKK